MSIELMAQVWKRQLNKAEQSILLAMADHAKDDGSDCYPSIERLAWKTDYSERQVRRVIQDLTRRGVLTIARKHGPNRPTNYTINLSKATPKPEFRGLRPASEKADTMSAYNLIPDTMSSIKPKADTMSGIKEDNMSANGINSGHLDALKRTFATPKADIAMSTKPSLTNKNDIPIQEMDLWAHELAQLEPTLPTVAAKRLASSRLETDDLTQFRVILRPDVVDGLDWLNRQAHGAIVRALSVRFGRRVNVEIVMQERIET